MRKILLGLLIVITLVANASIPGVNDSIFVEPKESKEYPQWLLADSINGVPIAMSKYYSEDINGFIIELFEVEDIITSKKRQAIFFHHRLLRTQTRIQCSYKELNIIINAIKKLYDYSQIPLVEDMEESVAYKKDVTPTSDFHIALFFDDKNNKWICTFGINDTYSPYYDVEILPILIDKMTNAVFKYDQREQMHREPLFKKESKNGYNQYYFDYGDSLVLKLVAKDNVNNDYSKELFAQKSNQKINNLLNEIIKNEYNDFDELSVYGMLDFVIDEQGDVSRVKLVLSNKLSEKLSDNTIGLMLKRAKNYKFLPISNKDKLNGVKYVNVCIPLAVKERITEFIERGMIMLSNTYKEPNLVSVDKGGSIQYFMDYGYGLDERYTYVPINENYLKKLVEERYIIDFNYKINGIVDDKYEKLKGLYNYGTIEIVVDKNGWVVYSKLLLKKIVSDELDEKTITRVLANIEDYKFKEIKEQDFPGVDYVKAFIPLNGNP